MDLHQRHWIRLDQAPYLAQNNAATTIVYTWMVVHELPLAKIVNLGNTPINTIHHMWMVTLLHSSDLQALRSCISSGVSNGSKFPGRFRVWLRPKQDNCNGSCHMENPDRSKWGSFTTKNCTFQVHNFASNYVFEYWLYRDMISIQILQF